MTTKEKKPLRIPQWFKQNKSKKNATLSLAKKLDRQIPNSICQEAKCPNRSECFNKGVLTFMILGITCTRNCAFCSVAHGKPLPPDKAEVKNILNAIKILNLRFVVLTSPNRDDLKDGGSNHYAFCITEIKKAYPKVKVEVLIPDFQGDTTALDTIIAAKPDVINHNMETVPSLYRIARRGSLFQRSLDVLAYIKEKAPHILSKSGLMVGLGETTEELHDTFKVIRESHVDILTLGQYLKPSKDNLDVKKYYTPQEFDDLKTRAETYGYPFVFSGPLVRSSYLADHVFEKTTPIACH
ncbi:MAG: lipoyl synthase [bacterium]